MKNKEKKIKAKISTTTKNKHLLALYTQEKRNIERVDGPKFAVTNDMKRVLCTKKKRKNSLEWVCVCVYIRAFRIRK